MRRFATCSSKHSIGTIRSSIYRSGRSDNLNNSSVNSIGTRLYASKVAVPAPKRPHPFDSVVYPMNSQYVDSMLEKWRSSPDSVDASWKSVFEQLTSQKPDQALVDVFKRPRGHDVSVESEGRPVSEKEVLDALRVSWLTRAYEVRGHLIANLDPLGMFSADLDFGIPRELELEYFGFSEEDLDRVFPFGISARLGGYHREAKRMPLRWIIQELRTIYCGTSGWEYMHIVDAKKTAWIRTQILNPTHQLSAQERKATYHDLALAEGFESFLATKYTTTKRFGLDGAEGLIPLLNRIIEEAAKKGVESFVIGMAHRGRLNVLANVCGKDVTKIFMEFEGKKHSKEDKENECGDVKYHLGISVNRYTRSGNPVNVELLPNPSHLETVDPVVCGTVRAKQHHEKDTGRSKVMAILIHGDAAYAGQGVCYESMGLGMLEYYNVGGTVHIVVNNQIGFTTNPKQSRSAPYCTELGKLIQAPIIHINADDLDETIRCAKIAVEWKTQYKQDVLIDLVCYRRYGHNETDEPSFTQPLMYRTIRKHPTALKLYSERLLKDNIMTKEEMDAEQNQIRDLFREKFEIAKGSVPTEHDWKEDQWKRHRNPLSALVLNSTAVAYKHLQEIGSKIATIPHGFEAHPTITRIFQERKKCYESGENVDWGAAEALAFATLILEGCQVRISGQDVERGTFSQRHALLVNMKDESVHVTLGTLHKDQGEFRVVNSSLSEYAVCGYELGYAMANDMSLIIWEAQFGDFANGAQIIFDQYLSSMESKWLKSVGMVINLPHGYDGMGPEHSSGRMERFLQSCDDSELPPSDYLAQCRMCTKPEELYRLNEEHVSKTNWQICFPSTPANYFHLLRRQMHRAFRKPLINFFSKAHLRAPNVSPLADFSERTSFCPVIDDPRFASSLFTSARKSKSEVRRVIFCTGQIYYTLATHFKKRHVEDIALVRVEQIAPFPWGYIERILEQYPKSAELMWVQEEPQNMGAYTFVRQRFSQYLRTVESSQVSHSLRVISRPPSAATASGIKALHDAEIQSILENAAQ